MTEEGPSKSELNAVFRKLRSAAANKICFDCGTNNPTWSSVTYGVFICIDCSAIHRGLGVHLSFVRSTQLDTNWTWLQLRAMQIGGNANATQFFRSHGCTTNDAQVKYKSRAAQLYREKLHHSAAAAMRLHGTKLHIDSTSEQMSPPATEKDVDFFEEITTTAKPIQASASTPSLQDSAFIHSGDNAENNGIGPSVDLLLSSSPPTQTEAKKPALLGQKTKKPAKKGLGAQKVGGGLNFEKIEAEAENLDRQREELANMPPQAVIAALEKESGSVTKLSERLMVQDLSDRDRKLKQMDPKRQAEAERLGMGWTSGQRSSIQHSAFGGFKTIEQEGGGRGSSSKKAPSSSIITAEPSIEDDWQTLESPSEMQKNRSSGTGLDDLFGSSASSRREASWDVDDEKRSKKQAVADYAPSDDAQKKFRNAKAISSDQFFAGQGTDFETRTSLNRFEGKNAISSSDFFGDSKSSGGTSNPSYGSNSYQMPDMTDVRESVRTGVTKVAGKLSQLSSNVQSYISADRLTELIGIDCNAQKPKQPRKTKNSAAAATSPDSKEPAAAAASETSREFQSDEDIFDADS